MGLINRVDGNGDLRAEDPALCAIGRDAVNGCQRIRGDHRAPPSDHVAIVVVVRWLDQNKLELFGGHGDIEPDAWQSTITGVGQPPRGRPWLSRVQAAWPRFLARLGL